MSIVCSSNLGWLISHSDYINKIYNDLPNPLPLNLKEGLFKINVPYTKRISKKGQTSKKERVLKGESDEIKKVQNNYEIIFCEFKAHFHLEVEQMDNNEALTLSDEIYIETEKFPLSDADGRNIGGSTIQKINESNILFPTNSRFFCRDVLHLSKYISNIEFDLILLDPPWWNKYIRRKRKKTPHAYNMMYNNELKDLKLENMLKENGMIVVWCTNSSQHINALKNEIFPKWGVNFTSKWYWLKITKAGEPICDFSTPPGKQPFEQIIFGCRSGRKIANPPSGKILLSVPSALHSHKPPLVEVLKTFLPTEPKCLEIFARYLLPHWTSYGNEVLKFQHESLYDIG